MKIKLFYVEDEPNLGKIVSETLEKQGFLVRWETDGLKVPASFEAFRPDLCLLDIMLPGIDGYTLCRQLHRQHPEVPIIFLTARTETQDLVKGFEAGGSDYIKKPFSMEKSLWPGSITSSACTTGQEANSRKARKRSPSVSSASGPYCTNWHPRR